MCSLFWFNSISFSTSSLKALGDKISALDPYFKISLFISLKSATGNLRQRLPSGLLISFWLPCQICSEIQGAISGENLRQTSIVVLLLKRPKFFLIYSLMEAIETWGLIFRVDGFMECILERAKSRGSSRRVQ